MKRIILLIFTAVVACAIISSCTSTLPGRFNSFVSSVEKHYESYSEDDWNKANDKFEKLFDEYKENMSSFNSEEKKEINSALVRYAKVVAKSSYGKVKGTIEEISTYVPGIIDGAKSLLKGLGISGTGEE